MNQYKRNSTCIKCGGHHDPNVLAESKYVKARAGAASNDPDQELSEHIRRTCVVCGFGWNEEVLIKGHNENTSA